MAEDDSQRWWSAEDVGGWRLNKNGMGVEIIEFWEMKIRQVNEW